MVTRILLLGLVVLVAMSMTTHAAILNTDGDFSAQTLGTDVTAPWGPTGGGMLVDASAQSPNTNVYADNGKGVIMPASDSYIVDLFSPQTAATAPMLYYSVDFRMNEAGAIQRFELGRDAGASDAVTFFANDTNFYITNGGSTGGWDYASLDLVTTELSLGTWYNVQLAVDLNARTYTGRISTPTASIGIATKSLIDAWDGTINCVFTDGTGPGSGVYDVDNFAVSTTPLTTIGPDPVFPPIFQTINLDFDGTRNDDIDPLTYQPTSGEVYNSILFDSRNDPDNDDNLSVSVSNLLDKEGNATTVGFSVSPVGGDQAPDYTDPLDVTSPEALLNDYLFIHSAGNSSDAPFTISGLGDAETINITLAPTSYNLQEVVIEGSSLVGDTFYDVPVVDGVASGVIGNGTGVVVVLKGMTISIPVLDELIPGDANEDGAVDVTDLGILATNYGAASGKTWGEGDFNDDGAVNVTDLGVLATYYGTGTAAAAVPEPSVLALLIAGLAILVWCKR